MKRRANKSTKVPNVKLRPAEPQNIHRTQRTEKTYAEATQITSDDATPDDKCPRPFESAVICATGIPEKRELFKLAIELGALTVLAFTDRVTHLVATDHGGAKYQCAIERKIPILRPEWITECYDIWLRGDDVDFNQSIDKYRLPIFSGVVVCVSGIDDLDRRLQIQKLVTRNGGTFEKELKRPVRVTHLLCSGDEETTKMIYAKKFNRKGEANIQLLWEEWFWDSLEFGGRFGEERYYVKEPRPERMKYILRDGVTLSETPCSLTPSSSLPPNPAPELEEEVASVSRKPDLVMQVHASLLRKRGWEISDGRLQKSPSKSRPSPRGNSPPPLEPVKKDTISSFRRANSFAPRTATAVPHPFKRSATTSNALFPNNEPSTRPVSPLPEADLLESMPPLEAEAGPSTRPTAQSPIFAGLKFVALGEAKSASVKSAIEASGGTLVGKDDFNEKEVDFVIVRVASGSKFYRLEEDETLRSKFRTECWLEKCLFDGRVCSPDEHPSFKPVDAALPINGAELLNVSFSGLQDYEACWTKRLLRAFGMNQASGFSIYSTHLVCPSRTGEKYEKAINEWNIPVVGFKWFEDISRTGLIPPFEAPRLQVRTSEGSRPVQPVKGNGKGKMKALPDSEPMMMDITNGNESQPSRIIEPRQVAIRLPEHPELGEADAPPRDHGMDTDPPPPNSPPPVPEQEPQPPPFSFGVPCLSQGGGPMESTPRDHMCLEEGSSQSQITLSLAGAGDEPSSIELRVPREGGRADIPSSRTPSPIKQDPGNSTRRGSSQPRGDIFAAGLTSLLGKRASFDNDGAEKQRKRGRAKPSRNPSSSSLFQDQSDNNPTPGKLDAVFEVEPLIESDFGAVNFAGEEDTPSVRVVYEDAATRDARLKLFGSGSTLKTTGRKPRMSQGGTSGRRNGGKRAS